MKIDLKDKHGEKLFEARDAINKLIDLGYYEYDEELFIKMLNETEAEIEKRMYK